MAFTASLTFVSNALGSISVQAEATEDAIGMTWSYYYESSEAGMDNWAFVAETIDSGSSVDAVELTGFTPGTYDIRVTITNDENDTDSEILAGVGPLAAIEISGLTGTAKATYIDLAVTLTPGTGSGTPEYVWRRAAGAVAPADAESGTSVGSDSDTIQDAGLTPATQYSYAVFVTDFSGTDDAAITKTTGTALTKGVLSVTTPQTTSSVGLTCTAATNGNGAPYEYVLQISAHGAGSWSNVSSKSATRTWTLSAGLSAGTEYDFRALCYDVSGAYVIADTLSVLMQSASVGFPTWPSGSTILVGGATAALSGATTVVGGGTKNMGT